MCGACSTRRLPASIPSTTRWTPTIPICSEASAYPAAPDSEYGWEKLFSERLYLAFNRNHGMRNRVARYHNIFGPEGTWDGGKEKAPAAICRKIAKAASSDSIQVWGDGNQTRSFLYIDECLEGTIRLTRSNFDGPVNIGSEEMVTINELVAIVADIAGKSISIEHIPGPLGVRGRNSDNRLIEREAWVGAEPAAEEGSREDLRVDRTADARKHRRFLLTANGRLIWN